MRRDIGTPKATDCVGGNMTFAVGTKNCFSRKGSGIGEGLQDALPFRNHEAIEHVGAKPASCFVENGCSQPALGAVERCMSMSRVSRDVVNGDEGTMAFPSDGSLSRTLVDLSVRVSPPVFASSSSLALGDDNKCLSDRVGHDDLCGTTGDASGCLRHGDLSSSQCFGKVAFSRQACEEGELMPPTSFVAGRSGSFFDAIGEFCKSKGTKSVRSQQLPKAGEPAQEEQKHGCEDGEAAVTACGRDDVAVRIPLREGLRGTTKRVVSPKVIVNGVLHSAHTERKATAAHSSHRTTPRKPTTKAFIPSEPFVSPQQTRCETTHLRTSSACNAFSGNFGLTGETEHKQKKSFADPCASSSQVSLKGFNKSSTFTGAAIDGACCESCNCARSSTPQQKQHFFCAGLNPQVFSFQGSTSVDGAQSGDGCRHAPGVSARTSPQSPQSSVLTQNVQKNIMPVTFSGQHWHVLPVHDFISCLQIYVETCLGLRESEWKVRHDFVARIQRIITKTLGPRAKVRVHGSITTDLALSSSDIDLLVVGYDPLSPLQAIQQVSQATCQIDEHELQQLESTDINETGEGYTTETAEGRFSFFCDGGLDGDSKGVFEEKCPAAIPASAIEENVVVHEGEFEGADSIMRVEEEEAEYRSQIERDYLFSTRAGLASAAMASSLPTVGCNNATMLFNGYINPFSTIPFYDSALPSFTTTGGGSGREGGATSDSLTPANYQRNASGYRLYIPTLDGPLFQVQTIISTRVPVIKVTEKSTGMKGDITFAGGEHWRSLRLTNYLLRRYPAARGLILFIKHCVRQMGIGDSQPGGVTSFAIYLLVLHFFNVTTRYIEGIMRERGAGKQSQYQDDSANLDAHAANESAACPDGTGDGSNISGGVNSGSAHTAASRSQSPLLFFKAAEITPFLSLQTPYFADRFSVVEIMLKRRLNLCPQSMDEEHNTATILRFMLSFVDEEELSTCRNDGKETKSGDRLLVRGQTFSGIPTSPDSSIVLGDTVCFRPTDEEHVDAASARTLLDGHTTMASEYADDNPNVNEGTEKSNNGDSANSSCDNNNRSDDNTANKIDVAYHGMNFELEGTDLVGRCDDASKGVLEDGKGEVEDTRKNELDLIRTATLRLLSATPLGYIFYDFCLYYGFYFDYENYGLYFDSSGNSRVVPKPKNCQRRGQHLFMTSPFDEQYDITARMLHTREFQELCRRFVPIMNPVPVIPGYAGSVCTLQQVLEWISPETAFKEIMEVYAAIRKQQQQHQQRQQQQQKQRQRVDVNAAQSASSNERFSLPQTFFRAQKCALSGNKMEKKEQKNTFTQSALNNAGEESPSHEGRQSRRNEGGHQKEHTSAFAASRGKTDRLAVEATSDVSPLFAAGPSSQAVNLEARGSDGTTARVTPTMATAPLTTSAIRRQAKRGDAGVDDSMTVSGGSAVAHSPTHCVVPLAASAPTTATLVSPTSLGAPLMAAPHTVPAVLGGGGNVGLAASESGFTRCQHSRQNSLQQQIPFGFPSTFHMFVLPQNHGGGVYQDPSHFYLPMMYPAEAIHHHHHHHHYKHHHPSLVSFQYPGYELGQMYHHQQQRVVYDAINGHGGGAVGSVMGWQGEVRGNCVSLQGGRARGRGGAHRGTSTNNSSHGGEKAVPVRDGASTLQEEATSAAEGAIGDNGNNTNNVSNGKSVSGGGNNATDAKERTTVDSLPFLLPEAHHYHHHHHRLIHYHHLYHHHFHYHHHHHHHQQQLQQSFPCLQHVHMHQNNFKSRVATQQQQQQQLWRQHHASMLMQPLYAFPNTVDAAVYASTPGGQVLRQSQSPPQNFVGPTHPATFATASVGGFSGSSSPAFHACDPDLFLGGENQTQLHRRWSPATAPQRPPGKTDAASSCSSAASNNRTGEAAQNTSRQSEGEDHADKQHAKEKVPTEGGCDDERCGTTARRWTE